MKDLSTNTISTIISMCAVLVMFIWGYIEGTFAHSWLAVFAGGIVVVIIRMIRKDKGNKGNSDKQ